MTPADIARLRGLVAKATKGPWSIQAYFLNSGTPDEICRAMVVDNLDYPIGIIDEKDPPTDGTDSLSHDIDLIVAMHESLPALLTLAEEAGRLRAALDSAPIMSKYHGHRGFEVDRFIADYEAHRKQVRAALAGAAAGETP